MTHNESLEERTSWTLLVRRDAPYSTFLSLPFVITHSKLPFCLAHGFLQRVMVCIRCFQTILIEVEKVESIVVGELDNPQFRWRREFFGPPVMPSPSRRLMTGTQDNVSKYCIFRHDTRWDDSSLPPHGSYRIHIGETQTNSPSSCSPRT